MISKKVDQKLYTDGHLFVDRLKKLIEDTYAAANDTKVVLITHSLGGLITSTFLHTVSQQWKDQHLHAWVSEFRLRPPRFS